MVRSDQFLFCLEIETLGHLFGEKNGKYLQNWSKYTHFNKEKTATFGYFQSFLAIKLRFFVNLA